MRLALYDFENGCFGGLFLGLVELEDVVGRLVLTLLTPFLAHFDMRGGLR